MSHPEIPLSLRTAVVGLVSIGTGLGCVGYEPGPNFPAPPVYAPSRDAQDAQDAQDELYSRATETLAIPNIVNRLQEQLGKGYIAIVERLEKRESVTLISDVGKTPHIAPLRSSKFIALLEEFYDKEEIDVDTVIHLQSADGTKRMVWAARLLQLDLNVLPQFGIPAYYPMEIETIDETRVRRIETHAVFNDDIYILETRIHLPWSTSFVTVGKEGIQEFEPHERYLDQWLILRNPEIVFRHIMGVSLQETLLGGFSIEDKDSKLRDNVYVVVSMSPTEVLHDSLRKRKEPQKVQQVRDGYRTVDDGKIIQGTSITVVADPQENDTLNPKAFR